MIARLGVTALWAQSLLVSVLSGTGTVTLIAFAAVDTSNAETFGSAIVATCTAVLFILSTWVYFDQVRRRISDG